MIVRALCVPLFVALGVVAALGCGTASAQKIPLSASEKETRKALGLDKVEKDQQVFAGVAITSKALGVEDHERFAPDEHAYMLGAAATFRGIIGGVVTGEKGSLGVSVEIYETSRGAQQRLVETFRSNAGYQKAEDFPRRLRDLHFGDTTVQWGSTGNIFIVWFLTSNVFVDLRPRDGFPARRVYAILRSFARFLGEQKRFEKIPDAVRPTISKLAVPGTVFESGRFPLEVDFKAAPGRRILHSRIERTRGSVIDAETGVGESRIDLKRKYAYEPGGFGLDENGVVEPGFTEKLTLIVVDDRGVTARKTVTFTVGPAPDDTDDGERADNDESDDKNNGPDDDDSGDPDGDGLTAARSRALGLPHSNLPHSDLPHSDLRG